MWIQEGKGKQQLEEDSSQLLFAFILTVLKKVAFPYHTIKSLDHKSKQKFHTQ